MRYLLGLLISAFPCLSAQTFPDWWALSAGCRFIVIDPAGPGGSLGYPGTSGVTHAIDEAGHVFSVQAIRGPIVAYQIEELTFQYPAQWTSLRLTTVAGFLKNLCVTRSALWFMNDQGELFHLDKGVSNQTATRVANVVSSLGIGGALVLGGRACCNGRDLFFMLYGNPTWGHSKLCAVDLESPSYASRVVCHLPDAIEYDMALGADGRPLVLMSFPSPPLSQAILSCDPVTGQVTSLTQVNPPAPAFGQSSISMGYDIWQDQVVVGERSGLSTTLYTKVLSSTTTWSVFWFSPFDTLWEVRSMAEPPFELFGIGCPNATGRDPRMGWLGLPQQGQSFTLTLRDAEPGGFAFLWLGLSESFWAPVGPLPFEASSMGAPGCRIYVSADVSYLLGVNATGLASRNFPVPINPSLAGWEFYAQTASTSSANSLGLAASDAVVIGLR